MPVLYYEYDDDAGTKYGVALTEGQQALYPVAIGTLSTGYASFALLQAAIPAALVQPFGLTLRTANVTSSVFGSCQIPILTRDQAAAIEPTGSTPFPETPVSFTDSVSITGYSGEQRLSN